MSERFDIFVIGGGVNGVAIARDAAGRGLSVALAEKGDLASETSSKSTKLFHGGLRYLEYFEFHLVREALREREILLANMPHIAWPMRFVLPYAKDQRFDVDTPVSKWLGRIFPWLKGRRPAWVIRAGLFLYDHLGGHQVLPKTTRFTLTNAPEGVPLHPQYETAFEYSDVWAQDARLVALMARDANARGANIMTRNKVQHLERRDGYWEIETEKGNFEARIVVNASGPWVEDLTRHIEGVVPKAGVRLVKGSHIVIPKKFPHDKAYFFQGRDGRIIFAIPYEQEFTLIGTTDMPHESAEISPLCSDEEVVYLCAFASDYFRTPVQPDEVIWRFAGVRPLYDDGAKSATAATREYVLVLHDHGAPLLNVFGGKITTHRKLAEDALEKLGFDGKWTANAPLAGGAFDWQERNKLLSKLAQDYPDIDEAKRLRLFNTYGLETWDILNQNDEELCAGLFKAEIEHLVRHEFAQSAEDILWRRTKRGLFANDADIAALKRYLKTL